MPRWSDNPPAGRTLQAARALQQDAAKLGFDWPTAAPVWDKLAEEVAELRDAVNEGDRTAIQHEWGDVLFSLVNLARFLDVDPEAALTGVCARFSQRLSGIQERLDELGRTWTDCSIQELEALWQQVKQARGEDGRADGE